MRRFSSLVPETAIVSEPRVFAAALATYPTRVTPLAAVVDLLTITHAPEIVQRYESSMRRGMRFPPIAVVRVPGCYLVADGHKRLAAYRALGHPHILVEVWTWRRWCRDQWRQGVRQAGRTGRMLRLSLSDRPAARQLLRMTTGHWARVARSLASRLR